MSKEIAVGKCGDVFVSPSGTHVCELPAGHYTHPSRKHRDGGVMWTQGGKERIAREMAEAAAKKS